MSPKYCIGVLIFSFIVSSSTWAKAPEEKIDFRLAVLESDIVDLKADIVELRKTNDGQNSDIRHLITDLTEAVNKIGLHEKSIAALQTDLAEAEQKIVLLETDVADMMAQSDDVGEAVFGTMGTQMKSLATEFGLFERIFSKKELGPSDIAGVIFPNLDDLITEMEAVGDNPLLHKLDLVEKWMLAKEDVEIINQLYAEHEEFASVDPDELNLMWKALLAEMEDIAEDLGKDVSFDLQTSASAYNQAFTAVSNISKKNHDHRQCIVNKI
ncbi:MAG: hypothetical protein HKP44_14965 [Desulfofustis sp.]|nr:hypothetical protein [Desulfofustis sp.]